MHNIDVLLFLKEEDSYGEVALASVGSCPETAQGDGLVIAASSTRELLRRRTNPCSPGLTFSYLTDVTFGPPDRRFKERDYYSGVMRIPARGIPAPRAILPRPERRGLSRNWSTCM